MRFLVDELNLRNEEGSLRLALDLVVGKFLRKSGRPAPSGGPDAAAPLVLFAPS